MITHVLKDGTVTESIAGKVIRSDEFPVLYKILEGGDERGETVSASDRSAGSIQNAPAAQSDQRGGKTGRARRHRRLLDGNQTVRELSC